MALFLTPAVRINPNRSVGLWGNAQLTKHMPEAPLLPLFKSLTGLVPTDPQAKDRF